MLAQELVDILACPRCKGAVEQDSAAQALLCRPCGLAFPIRRHGERLLPVMLVEEASPIAGHAASDDRQKD